MPKTNKPVHKATIEDCNRVYKKHTGMDLIAYTNRKSGNVVEGDTKRFTEEELYVLFSIYKDEKGWIEIPKPVNGEIQYIRTPVIISVAGFSNWLRRQGGIGIKSVRHYLYHYDTLHELINEELEEHTTVSTGTGQVSTAMGIFYLKNKCGYTDKLEQNITSDNNQTIQIINDLKDTE